MNQIYKTNTILNIVKNQDNFLPQKNILDNPEDFFRSQPLWRLEMFNFFLYTSKKHKTVFINQSKLAHKFGKTREWVNKVLHRFQEWGLLHITYRHKKSCIYTVSPWFNLEGIIFRLSHIFKALRGPMLAIMFPISASSADIDIQFTHIKERSSRSYFSFSNVYRSRLKHTETNSHSTKKVVKAMDTEFISPAILEITPIMRLTKAGQVMLSVFPDEAIRFAHTEMGKIERFRNPFGFFYNSCKKYCDEKKIRLQWDFIAQLRKKYNVNATDEVTEKKTSGNGLTNVSVSASSFDKAGKGLKREGGIPKTTWKPLCVCERSDNGKPPKSHEEQLEALRSFEGVNSVIKLAQEIGLERARELYNGMIRDLDPTKCKKKMQKPPKERSENAS